MIRAPTVPTCTIVLLLVTSEDPAKSTPSHCLSVTLCSWKSQIIRIFYLKNSRPCMSILSQENIPLIEVHIPLSLVKDTKKTGLGRGIVEYSSALSVLLSKSQRRQIETNGQMDLYLYYMPIKPFRFLNSDQWFKW